MKNSKDTHRKAVLAGPLLKRSGPHQDRAKPSRAAMRRNLKQQRWDHPSARVSISVILAQTNQIGIPSPFFADNRGAS